MITISKSKERSACAGLLQGYIENEGEGWSYVLDNVGKYFEGIINNKPEIEKTPHLVTISGNQDEKQKYPEMRDIVGTYFLENMGLLGRRTGELHCYLASLLDDNFIPESFTLLYQKSVYQSMRNLAKGAFNLLKENAKTLPKEFKTEIDEVMAYESKIINVFSKVVDHRISAKKIRIHGDYHLGQTLFNGKDFYIIDFEGEPARLLSERRLKRSPLRDVAGMIRSFDYAIYSGMAKHPLSKELEASSMQPWVRAWYYSVSSEFFRAYINAVKGEAFLPSKPEDFEILFNAFLLEKAVYELGYELNNRPDWVFIPIRGIKSIFSE